MKKSLKKPKRISELLDDLLIAIIQVAQAEAQKNLQNFITDLETKVTQLEIANKNLMAENNKLKTSPIAKYFQS